MLALVVGLALQVGVNYANDYSDGIRGTDAERVGPLRLVGSGLARAAVGQGGGLRLLRRRRRRRARPGRADRAAGGCWPSGPPAILAAWFYTGGAHPYGYRGLGEVFVFVFFGLVAVGGTIFVQLGRCRCPDCSPRSAIGLLACALLVANNLRDLRR